MIIKPFPRVISIKARRRRVSNDHSTQLNIQQHGGRETYIGNGTKLHARPLEMHQASFKSSSADARICRGLHFSSIVLNEH